MPVPRAPAVLAPIVERVNTAFCWVRRPGAPHPSRIAEPLNEAKIRLHLNGGNQYGACPMRPGESTTRLALLDLDSHRGVTPWENMRTAAEEIIEALELVGLRPTAFRSTGGQGIHLYLLWDEPQDAKSVRRFLRDILTGIGYADGTQGVSGKQIEVFPKQDRIPAIGYGSMFILPYAGRSHPLSTTLWRISAPVPPAEDPPIERVIVETPAADLDMLKRALDAIPNSGDKELSYDQWRNVIFAVHQAGSASDTALDLAHAFSSRSNKYNREFLDTRVWPYCRSERDGQEITAEYVYSLAEQHGWDERIAADFAVVGNSDAESGPGIAAPTAGSDLKKNPDRFPALSAAQFALRPAPRWIVKGVLPEAELAMIFGASKSGKSFFVLDLMMSIARGEPWRGNRVRQGECVYLAAEGAGGFRNRLLAYAMHHEIDLESLPLRVIAGAPNLLLARDVTDIAAAVGTTSVLVVDTMAQVMPGGNENASEDVGRLLAHGKRLHALTGALVVLIHHSGKDELRGARGWSGMLGAMDCEIEVTRDNGDRTATVTKAKDGDEGGEFGFRLSAVAIGVDADNDPITSCVVEYTDPVARRERKRTGAPSGSLQRTVLAQIHDLAGMGDGSVPVEEVIRVAIAGMVVADGTKDHRREHIKRTLDAMIRGGFVSLTEGVLRIV